MDAEGERARKLRREMTEAERLLWSRLRGRQLRGCKFRRQRPIGQHIVDFACLEKKLVVELDGGQHLDAPGDERRTRFVEASGFEVLRFWDNEVFENIDAVLQVIHDALE